MPVALAACGGGGGGGQGERDLVVAFSSPTEPAYLWRQTTLAVPATGLEGYTPNCTAMTPLPAGLSFGDGCRIVGVPTAVGPLWSSVRMGVNGFRGAVDQVIRVEVVGPSIGYSPLFPSFATPFSYTPRSTVDKPWTPAAGDTLTYRLASGTLPPGLRLDPNNGTISGIPTTRDNGRFSVTIQATSGSRSYVVTTDELSVTPNPGLTVEYGSSLNVLRATVGQRWDATPWTTHYNYPQLATYRFANWRLQPGQQLPPGLALAADTGAIGGVPTTAAPQTTVGLQVDITVGGETATIPVQLWIVVAP